MKNYDDFHLMEIEWDVCNDGEYDLEPEVFLWNQSDK